MDPNQKRLDEFLREHDLDISEEKKQEILKLLNGQPYPIIFLPRNPRERTKEFPPAKITIIKEETM